LGWGLKGINKNIRDKTQEPPPKLPLCKRSVGEFKATTPSPFEGEGWDGG